MQDKKHPEKLFLLRENILNVHILVKLFETCFMSRAWELICLEDLSFGGSDIIQLDPFPSPDIETPKEPSLNSLKQKILAAPNFTNFIFWSYQFLKWTWSGQSPRFETFFYVLWFCNKEFEFLFQTFWYLIFERVNFFRVLRPRIA